MAFFLRIVTGKAATNDKLCQNTGFISIYGSLMPIVLIM